MAERLEKLARQDRLRAVWFMLLLVPIVLPLLRGRIYYEPSILYRTALFSQAGNYPTQNADLFDPVVCFYPNQVILNQALAEGQLPWWNPYNFGGTPLIANGQAGALYPPRLVLHLFFSTTTVADLLILLHLFGAGYFMSKLGRCLGLSGLASVFMGTVWMFTGAVSSDLELGLQVTNAAWVPLLLLLTDRCRYSWKAVGGLGLATGIFVSHGNMQYVLVALILVLLFGLGILCGREGAGKSILRAAIGALLGILLALPLLLPTGLHLMAGSRPKLESDFVIKVHKQFLQSSSATFFLPEIAGSPVTGFSFRRGPAGGTFAFWETVVYAGSITLILAPLGLTRPGISRYAALLGLIFLLFPATDSYAWIQEHQGADRLYSSRFLLIYHFCIADS
jgi:hypothetical protein